MRRQNARNVVRPIARQTITDSERVQRQIIDEGYCRSTSSKPPNAAYKALIDLTHALPVATASLTVGIARLSAYWRVSLGFMHHCFTQPMRTYASEHVSISCWAMIGKTPGVDEVHCAT